MSVCSGAQEEVSFGGYGLGGLRVCGAQRMRIITRCANKGPFCVGGFDAGFRWEKGGLLGGYWCVSIKIVFFWLGC
jgi:hypothetical protein